MKSPTKCWLALTLLIMVLVLATLLLRARWQAWFGNEPEDPYETEAIIDRLTLTPGANFLSERTLSWRYSDVLTESSFEYAPLTNNNSVDSTRWTKVEPETTLARSRSGAGYYFHVRLTRLTPGRTYQYIIRQGADSLSGTFSIPTGLDTLTRLVYLGDIQDPNGELSQRVLPTFDELQASDSAAHFFALAGDQLEGPSDKYWQVWYSSWSKGFLARTPFILSTGNHEYLKRGFGRELDPRWVPQYNYPTNGPKDFEGRTYYVDFPLVRFIVLDSNGINSPADILRHRSWLRGVLEGSSQRWQIVMFHHAVHSVREGRNNPIMRYVYKPILDEYGADLVLQGHDHAYSRITTKTTSGEKTTPVYIISTSSPKVYRNEFDDKHDKLGSGLQLYQTIELRHESLSYRSYLYSGELYDEFRIHYAGREATCHEVEDLGVGIPERFEFNAFGQGSRAEQKANRYRAATQERISKNLSR
ncbi:MAG: metallophosphoesterase family protein [Porphyromonadaceae bacterium]|nr:metallophosphoesterase family protein [Porphyromonadaceae bacterium]